MIPFNRPHLTGDETIEVSNCFSTERFCGDGPYTKACQKFFKEKLASPKCLLTTSCTDALEMCAILCNISPGDEVIVPSYTFVSSALAFVREGAKIIFADSRSDSPCIDQDKLEPLITPHTKAIVVVHYAGVACDMDPIMKMAEKHNLIVVEDAAQGYDSYYKGRPLGSIGHLSAFSFHETKNIQCGEGGLVAINDPRFIQRAEIIWEKGTNREQFFRGEIDKYGWKDIGSSFLPNELTASFLWAQLMHSDEIQEKRRSIWQQYYEGLKDVVGKRLQPIPDYTANNGHMFYLVCSSLEERTNLIQHLKENGISAVFHYLSLHKSDYMLDRQPDVPYLPQSDRYTDQLVRLPLFYDLTKEEIGRVINSVRTFFENPLSR